MIDWVGGLADLRARVIRTIGDPGVRLREDPVRMLRAVALAARLDFSIDQDTVEAIRALRGEIVRSSPARILDEFYKILRQGRSRETFQMLHDLGLLAYLLPEADQAIADGGARLLGRLGRLDARQCALEALPLRAAGGHPEGVGGGCAQVGRHARIFNRVMPALHLDFINRPAQCPAPRSRA